MITDYGNCIYCGAEVAEYDTLGTNVYHHVGGLCSKDNRCCLTLGEVTNLGEDLPLELTDE